MDVGGAGGEEGADLADVDERADEVDADGARRRDADEAAVRLVSSYATAEEAFRQSRSGRNLIANGPELEADIPRCARTSVLGVVPRLVGMRGVAAEIAVS